jgi:hypothetical protein
VPEKQNAKDNIWIYERGIMGVWRKLHNEELHNSCCSTNIIRAIK